MMARLRADDIRAMKPEERAKKLKELREEYIREMGMAAMGGAPVNPGRIRTVRRDIARLLTIMHEEGEI